MIIFSQLGSCIAERVRPGFRALRQLAYASFRALCRSLRSFPGLTNHVNPSKAKQETSSTGRTSVAPPTLAAAAAVTARAARAAAAETARAAAAHRCARAARCSPFREPPPPAGEWYDRGFEQGHAVPVQCALHKPASFASLGQRSRGGLPICSVGGAARCRRRQWFCVTGRPRLAPSYGDLTLLKRVLDVEGGSWFACLPQRRTFVAARCL